MNPYEQTSAGDELEIEMDGFPLHLTRLVGREQALSELTTEIWRSRLLSLCGTGGIGKTRLAAALAQTVLAEFPGGAWWVDLSTTLDPAAVPHVVAATVIPETPVVDSPAVAVARAAERSLLVLDTCEQVVEAAAELVTELLARTESLRVITTSRQPLGVPGEQVWRVPGLRVDDDAPVDDNAAALFIERAREAASSFDAEASETCDAIARICRWTDGVPLAIELAAGRVSVLGVTQVAERLERDSTFLRHTSRTAPARHRTLQDSLEWSRGLLDPEEERLLARLSVFAGSFSLTAAESICADDALSTDDVLDLLGRLVDRSLVQVVDADGAPIRYRLLSSTRQCAATMLDDCGESDAVRGRCADWFCRVADAAASLLDTADQIRGLDDLDVEHDNVAQVLAWLVSRSAQDAARLACRLWPFWHRRGHYAQAREWFELALALGDDITPPVRAAALRAAGEIALLQGDYDGALGYTQEALALLGGLSDGDAAAAIAQLGAIARAQGRYEEAFELHGRSHATYEQLGDRRGIASSRNDLGYVSRLVGDCSSAESHGLAALAEFRRAGHLDGIARALVNLGAAALCDGEVELAAQRLEEALALARRLGFQEIVASSLHALAIVGGRRRRPLHEQTAMLRDALTIHGRLGDRSGIATVLEEIAHVVLARQDLTRAAEMIAYTEVLRERLGAPLAPVQAADRDAATIRIRGRLSRTALGAAQSEGGSWDLDHAVAVAFDAIAQALDAPAHEATGRPAPVLTPRELAVLERITKGHTNREIAAELYISASTAGVHVSNILRKLGAKRRVDATGLAHSLGLLALS